MTDLTVLMTGAGSPGARGYIHSLKNNGERKIKVIGTDIRHNIDTDNLSLLDKFYVIPKAKTPEYKEAIIEICDKENVNVILPLNTVELEYLSECKEEFLKHNITICVMPIQQLTISNNKAKLLNKLSECGVAVPEYRIIKSLEDFISGAKQLGYPKKPICVKRPDGNGSRGVRFIDPNFSEIDAFLYLKPNSMYICYDEMLRLLPQVLNKTDMILMEMIPGQEYSVDSLVYEGKTIVSVCRRVDVVEHSIDVDATIDQREDVLNYCADIAEKLKLSGCVGYGIRLNEKNEPMILEINPRLQATTILSVMGGANFPYYAIKAALNEPIEPPTIKEGIRITQRTQKLFHDVDGNIFYRM